MNREELIAWARGEADRLEDPATIGNARQAYTIRHETLAATEFLARQAPGSQWALQSVAYQNGMNVAYTLVHSIAGMLRSWAKYVDEGLAQTLPIEVEKRIDAASDLMEQVETLLADRTVHAAAPVVLAGAALEEMLRSMMPSGVTVDGNPGLDKYGAVLKKAGLISATEAKDITAWAGQRNEAAHGHFEQLNRDRARLMADAINLFMRRHDARL